MTWEVLNVIGTIAISISGAIVAMEEDYDILGVLGERRQQTIHLLIRHFPQSQAQ